MVLTTNLIKHSVVSHLDVKRQFAAVMETMTLFLDTWKQGSAVAYILIWKNSLLGWKVSLWKDIRTASLCPQGLYKSFYLSWKITSHPNRWSFNRGFTVYVLLHFIRRFCPKRPVIATFLRPSLASDITYNFWVCQVQTCVQFYLYIQFMYSYLSVHGKFFLIMRHVWWFGANHHTFWKNHQTFQFNYSWKCFEKIRQYVWWFWTNHQTFYKIISNVWWANGFLWSSSSSILQLHILYHPYPSSSSPSSYSIMIFTTSEPLIHINPSPPGQNDIYKCIFMNETLFDSNLTEVCS